MGGGLVGGRGEGRDAMAARSSSLGGRRESQHGGALRESGSLGGGLQLGGLLLAEKCKDTRIFICQSH